MSGQMIPYFRCWLCRGVINPKGSVFNLDLYSLFLVNKELLSLTADHSIQLRTLCHVISLCGVFDNSLDSVRSVMCKNSAKQSAICVCGFLPFLTTF